ncbi:MarR family winged helix-turn-helix transcriptional regulator [Priestia koreensis]|uniref:MarR family winged helix-turn-helix transcriptional regulator n=1 Tax=Priestia koreensis TaxID=284581 RepID=UPI0028F6E678|nr:MarR family transcriptional regulator [Priestia koreensis]
MAKKNAVSLISRIREEANHLLLSELHKRGITGLAPSHGDLLWALYKFKRLTMKELAEAIYRTKPTVTVLVNKLVSLELIQKQRAAEDSRVTYITLTRKGEELQGIFQEVSDVLNEVVYGDLSSGEQVQLEELLEKVLGRF